MKDSRYPDRFAHPEADYAAFASYKAERGRISMAEMRQDMMDRVNLFGGRVQFDFERLNECMDQVTAALPAIRRIFARPITHLKDRGEILPVESVRVVNNRTVVHASSHSELWSDLTPEGIKPRKLMTIHYEDEYAIYENLMLVRGVDAILGIVQRNLRILREMLEGEQALQVNLLDRRAHASYFLALGKLHYGYRREYALYREPAERCMEKLLFVERVLSARKNTHLYKSCTGKGQGMTLTKTNIFRGQKDYSRIWNLLKWMNQNGLDQGQEQEMAVGEGYTVFLAMLTVFGSEHFGFDFSRSETVDFDRFEAVGSHRGWYLMIDTIGAGEIEGIRMTFFKDKLYRVLILPPLSGGEEERAEIADRLTRLSGADRVLLADPWQLERGSVHLSRFDPDSFPRIWQILMEGMLMSDTRHAVCPFCGGTMVEWADADRPRGMTHRCAECDTMIGMDVCPETKREYPISSICGYEPPIPRDVADHGTAMKRKDLQRLLYFRNVTPIGAKGELLCPFCGEWHEE